jgi:hypothetical protein
MTRVPWRTILTHAPTIVDAARSFYGVSRRTGEGGGNRADASETLQSVRARVADLEQDNAEQVTHVADLTRQVQELGVTVEGLRTRVRQWVVATSVALVVSIVSAALAFWYAR